MPNPKMLLSLFLLVFLLVFPSLFAQETITITTYYPSPYGSYGYLHTDKFGVGDNDGSGGPTEADIPITSGNVWIAGNVGIGTTAPGANLDIKASAVAETGIRIQHAGGNGYSASLTLNNTPSTGTGGEYLVGVSSSGNGDIGGDKYFVRDTSVTTPNTAASYRFILDASGNVGIGTAAPYGKLSVAAGTGLTNHLTLFATDAAANGNIAGITFSTTGVISRPRAAIYAIGTQVDASPGWAADLVFATRAAADGTTILTSDERMRITSTGNVGIGTASPGQKLDVQGSNGSAGEIYSALSWGNIPSIVVSNTSATANNWTGLAFGDDTSGGVVAAVAAKLINHTTGESALSFGTTNSAGTLADRMRIDSSGNVGIGTASPLEQFVVSSSKSGGSTNIQARSPTDAAGNYSSLQAINSAGRAVYLSMAEASAGSGYYYHAGDATLAATANAKLHLRAGATDTGLTIDTAGNVGIGTASPGYTLTVSGTAWVTSGAWSGSDLRWKENIKTLPDETLNKVLKLRGVSFDWKRAEFKGNNFPEGRQIGLIAQELEKEFPELVTTDNQGYKAIAYDRFTAVLLEAIKAQQQGQQQQQNQDQEQQKQLQKQQREIENLKAEIASLKKKL